MTETGLDVNILHLLAAGESGSAPIADALGESRRTVQDRLAGLRERGLVEQPTRGVWTLSGAGQRAALAAMVPEPTASIAILDDLPTEHRADLRLIEDAVVARRALRNVYASNWPGFVMVGPTKSGKTLVGSLAARRFGLDPVDAVRLLQMETPGSLLARRVQTAADTWTSVPSPLLAMPLIVLDEYDKAAPELRQAAFAYLAGASRYRSEDAVRDVHATAIVTLNAERNAARLLPDAVLRRAVVLDTTLLRDAVRDLDEVARRLVRVVLPQVPLDLVPPAAEFPEEARRWLRLALQSCLTAVGWGLVDPEAISRLALGRWATVPADLPTAVHGVVADYLLVSATRPGIVEPDWPSQIEANVGGVITPIATTLATARSRQAAHEEQQAATARTELDATMALAGERERLHDALDHALRSPPRGSDLTSSERAIIARARGAGRPLRAAIAEARSLAALGELEQRLEAGVLVPLRGVADAVAARREAVARTRAQQRQRDVDVRRQAGERDRAARQAAILARRAAKTRHAALQALYRRTRTQPGESVFEALLAAGCLSRESERYEAETRASQLARSRLGRGLRALTGAAAPPVPSAPPPSAWGAWTPPQPLAPVPSEPAPVYQTKTRSWYEDRAGRRYQAGEMVAWGSPAVDAVLKAAPTAAGLPPRPPPTPRRASPRRP